MTDSGKHHLTPISSDNRYTLSSVFMENFAVEGEKKKHFQNKFQNYFTNAKNSMFLSRQAEKNTDQLYTQTVCDKQSHSADGLWDRISGEHRSPLFSVIRAVWRYWWQTRNVKALFWVRLPYSKHFSICTSAHLLESSGLIRGYLSFFTFEAYFEGSSIAFLRCSVNQQAKVRSVNPDAYI